MDGILLSAVFYLAAAAISAPIATRLGLGSVLGYLIAGAVIGPWALNLVGDTEQVSHVAEFGVVILLFLIGLEVRPALLWSMRTAILGLGSAQLLLSAAALAAGAMLLGLDWRAATAAGLILAMSSTAIVLQILEEKGLRRGRTGLAAFGVLLFQDLAVIPVLALLPVLAVGGAPPPEHGVLAGQPPWVATGALFAAVAVVLLSGRFLVRPLFRFIAKARLRESFTATALLIVVAVAVLMETVGLSPALGAFLAGTVLAESEFRREIETDIEPFRGLLLGIFFITVGAGLNMPLVAARPVELVGLVVGIMAIKALVLFAVCCAFRFAWREAGTIGVVLAQSGEFAFVLLTFALGQKVLTPEIASLMTAAVALSMAATPLFILLWDRLARQPARPAEPIESTFDESEPDVIIAGFGRFGQVVGRVLNANGFATSVLENSVEQIELLRRFGRRVYYGDAGRLDLLRAAGAEKARALVVAIDDRDRAAEIVEMAREAFPNLTVLARAFDRRHAYELLNKGAHSVERETFEGGLGMAVDTLRALGWRAYRAERAARLFRRHDERQLEALRPLWGDEEKFRVASRESNPRMEDLLRADLRQMMGADTVAGDGWDTASLYEELRRTAGPVTPDAPEAEPEPRAPRGPAPGRA